MNARLVTACGLCGSANLTSVLHLGSSPPTCVMVPVGTRQASEDHYPLELLRCDDCTLVQLSVMVDPAVMFPADYPYSSGNSRALHANFEDLAQQAVEAVCGLKKGDVVVDIGANDGTLLSKFPQTSNGDPWGKVRRVAVEPTRQIEKWRIQGRPGYRAPFSEGLAKQMLGDLGPVKVITACNVLAHVEDIHDVMRGIRLLLADDGILVAENHDLASIMAGQWDTVYHEHLRYWDPKTFHRLLIEHGLRADDWQEIPTHGGSFRVIASKGKDIPDTVDYGYRFDLLRRLAAQTRIALRKDLSGTVYGIGATARATTIINYCGLDVEDVECVCEVPGSDKLGHYIPGTRIPVVTEMDLIRDQPPRALIFSWHMADSIIPALRAKGYRGTFMVPLPEVQHIYPPSQWLHKSPTARFG